MVEKTLVCGSRSIDDLGLVRKAIQQAPFRVSHIVHGGADGVDSNADRYAALNDIETQVVEPNYRVYGDAAPLKRNKAMVEMADTVIAIWDGESRGTKFTIEYASDYGMSEIERKGHENGIGVIYLGR